MSTPPQTVKASETIRVPLMATATSLGTSTAKTLLNGGTNVTMPAWARSLVGVYATAALVTITANEALNAKLILDSDDVALLPYEVPFAPQMGCLGATSSNFQAKSPYYPINAALQGGEEIKVYGQALVANTVAPYAEATLIVSDKPPADRQVFAKMGTLTSAGTSAAETTGTAYSIHGADQIIEVLGVQTGTTQAASKPVMGYFRISSNDFKVAAPIRYSVVPLPAILGALGLGMIGGINRYPVKVPTNTTCTLQDYFNQEIAVTTAGNWVSGVLFNKAGR